MGLATNQSATRDRLDVSPASFERRIHFGFQFSLAWILIASAWRLLGFEPQTSVENRLQLSVIGFGYALCAGLWIASSRLSFTTKWASILTCLVSLFLMASRSASEFDASCRVLEPAHLKNGRVIHEGLELSYATLPDSRVNLQPLISRSLTAPPTSGKLPGRLRFGELAVLSRIEMTRRAENLGQTPATSVLLEVQPDTGAGLNLFIRDVRQLEQRIAAWPNVKILRHTHRSKIAGLELVEFEFLEEPKRRSSRQVFLRTGTFVLNFMLNTDQESDRPMFDEFLKSIRLGSPRGREGHSPPRDQTEP